MSGVQINFNAATVAPQKPLDPIPSGWYRAIIEDSEIQPTQKQGGQMIALTLKVIDGEYAGRKLFDRLNIVNDNPQAVQIAYETLSAICHAVGVIQCGTTAELHNKPLLVKVKLKSAERGDDGKDYDARNEVKGYDNIQAARKLADTPALAGGVAGAPAGQPVWAAGGAGVPAGAPAAAAAPAPAVGGYQPPVAAAPQPWEQPAAAAAPPAQPFVAPPPVAAPAPPARVMLPAAGGVSYEAHIASGWTDEMLIQHGKMAAPVAAPPPAAVAAPPPGVAPPPPGGMPAAQPVAPGAPAKAPWER